MPRKKQVSYLHTSTGCSPVTSVCTGNSRAGRRVTLGGCCCCVEVMRDPQVLGFFLFFLEICTFEYTKSDKQLQNLRKGTGEDRDELVMFLFLSITTLGLYRSLINLPDFIDCFSLLHHPKYLTIINSSTTKHQ